MKLNAIWILLSVKMSSLKFAVATFSDPSAEKLSEWLAQLSGANLPWKLGKAAVAVAQFRPSWLRDFQLAPHNSCLGFTNPFPAEDQDNKDDFDFNAPF